MQFIYFQTLYHHRVHTDRTKLYITHQTLTPQSMFKSPSHSLPLSLSPHLHALLPRDADAHIRHLDHADIVSSIT